MTRRCCILFLCCLAVVCAQPQQPITTVSPIIQQFSGLARAWFALISPFANGLFWALVLIDLAVWASLSVFNQDLSMWAAGLVKKILCIGFFYALLLHASTWIPAIVDSFYTIGLRASGFVNPLSPSDVFSVGSQISAIMLSTAANQGWFSGNIGTALALVFAAATTFLAFVLITMLLIMAMIQGYIVLGMGSILLAFGGAQWTRPYAERYLGLAISTGIRIMITMMLIGGGIVLAAGWVGITQQIPGMNAPAQGAFEIMGASLIFLSICWELPRYCASIIGGAPSFTGYEAMTVSSSLMSMILGGMYAGGRLGSAAGGMASGGGASGGTPATSVAAASQMGSNTSSGTGSAGKAKAVTGGKP